MYLTIKVINQLIMSVVLVYLLMFLVV